MLIHCLIESQKPLKNIRNKIFTFIIRERLYKIQQKSKDYYLIEKI
jgi:hypothetical protein